MACLSFRSCAWLTAIALAVLGIELTAAGPVCAACGDYVRLGNGHSSPAIGQRNGMTENDHTPRNNWRFEGPRGPQKCDSPACRGESPAPVSPVPSAPDQTAEDWAC